MHAGVNLSRQLLQLSAAMPLKAWLQSVVTLTSLDTVLLLSPCITIQSSKSHDQDCHTCGIYFYCQKQDTSWVKLSLFQKYNKLRSILQGPKIAILRHHFDTCIRAHTFFLPLLLSLTCHSSSTHIPLNKSFSYFH